MKVTYWDTLFRGCSRATLVGAAGGDAQLGFSAMKDHRLEQILRLGLILGLDSIGSKP
jgi:hypothetical protein